MNYWFFHEFSDKASFSFDRAPIAAGGTRAGLLVLISFCEPAPGIRRVPTPPGHERAQLVADLARYLLAWEQALGRPEILEGNAVNVLHQQSLELQARAGTVGFGGVAHHLARCNRFLEPRRPLDVAGLRSALKDLSELAWQAKQEIVPADRVLVEQSLAHAAGRAGASVPYSISPPPMLTIYPKAANKAPTKAGAEFPPVHEPPPPAMPPLSLPAVPPLSPLLVPPSLSSTLHAPAPVAPSAVAVPAPSPAQPRGPSSPSVEPAPVSASAPKLAVRTMFGLRAFNRAGSKPTPVPAPDARDDSLLGLRGFSGSAPPAAPPRMLSSTLPPLPGHHDPARDAPQHPSTAPAMKELLGRFSKDPEKPRRSSRPKEGSKPVRPKRVRRSSSGGWWVGAIAAIAVIGLALAAVIGWGRLRAPSAPGASAASTAVGPRSQSAAQRTSSGPEPTEARAVGDDQLRALLEKAHGQGGNESPELRAWVDHQAAIQAKLLETGRCDGSAAACSALFKARADVLARAKVVAKKKSAQPLGGLRPRWLAGLKMPEKFPVQDDPRVQRVFEKYTDTQVGRALFESMLFRCGSYRDRIEEALIRYELPPSLLAVVFAESGCNPLAKSPVGAEGLWQFMPEAGRAYHLYILEDVIDERHSPPKATEAAIHFLADLYKKFGSWDLVFAAYNMGPYGLVARMQRAGGDDVGFWDLLDANLLPAETSQYVPIIEAFALILENLQHLKFGATQMRAPEVTADLDARPGTRLSLIARAASTSVNQLRLLNLDLKGDTVPNIPGQLFPVQVPKDVVWQARDTLQALATRAAYEDQCVPPTFDWGKQRFSPEMLEECRRKLGGAAPRAGAGP